MHDVSTVPDPVSAELGAIAVAANQKLGYGMTSLPIPIEFPSNLLAYCIVTADLHRIVCIVRGTCYDITLSLNFGELVMQ